MKFVLPGTNVKVLGKAVQALGRIGDEMYIVADDNVLSLQGFSMSASSYARFNFTRNFFTVFDMTVDGYRGKISMKSALLPFRSVNMFEKTVDECTLELDNSCDDILITLKFRKGITKTYCLPLIENENLLFSFDIADCTNKIAGPSSLLTDLLQDFSQAVREVTLRASGDKLDIFTHAGDRTDPTKTVYTLVTILRDKFSDYSFNSCAEAAEITFCLKEFRAMQAFSEGNAVQLNINFDKPGKPLICTYDGMPGMEVMFVTATLSESSQPVAHEVPTKNRNGASVAKKSSVHNLNNQIRASTSAKSRETPFVENEENHLLDDAPFVQPVAKKIKKSMFIGVGPALSETFTSQLPGNDEVLAEASDED
ncbi:cell cycle checkpoint control protein RAD9A-like [Ornithodoros turicata]|uniref:cell cycle checkpoint control protein RAD9A-like n=1 Tax=Ornithodoros turicata TaxID=34597 RepID=UPI00313898FF